MNLRGHLAHYQDGEITDLRNVKDILLLEKEKK